jgi:hypothetical protein
MKINRTTQLFTAIAVGLAWVAIAPKPGVAGTNFYCNMNAPTGHPTVYAQTPSGGKPVMALYSQDFKRYQTWVNHNISRRIVDSAYSANQAIALEDLTGIRERTNLQCRSKT